MDEYFTLTKKNIRISGFGFVNEILTSVPKNALNLFLLGFPYLKLKPQAKILLSMLDINTLQNYLNSRVYIDAYDEKIINDVIKQKSKK